MAEQIEIEFRVYRTHEPGGGRECIATRSIPHAMQVWNESMDAFSRSLELVISGDWLMDMLAQGEVEGCEEVGEVERAKIIALCLEALSADSAERKRRCIEEVLITLGHNRKKKADE